MYRGVVQEQIYWTDYLQGLHRRARSAAADASRADLAHRARHDQDAADAGAVEGDAGAARARRCRIRTAGGATRRSSCWCSARDTSVVPQLTQLAAQPPDWRTKLHALWTLDGLDAMRPELVQKALDRQVAGRARGRRPAVGALAGRRRTARWPRAVLKLAGRSELDRPPPAGGVDRRAAGGGAARAGGAMLTKYGSDPILVDVTISGLKGQRGGRPEPRAAAERRRRRGGRGGDAGRGDGQERRRARTCRRSSRARPMRPCRPGSATALLQGLDTGLPAARRRPRRPRRRARRGCRSSRCPCRREPTALVALGEGDDDAGRDGQARGGEARLAGQAGAGRRSRRR